MDPFELALWTDSVYHTVVCSQPEEAEVREFFGEWFRDLVNHRERRGKDEVASDRVDRS